MDFVQSLIKIPDLDAVIARQAVANQAARSNDDEFSPHILQHNQR
jgi:hypothetical protein